MEKYTKPITRYYTLDLESQILAGSVVIEDEVEVQTMGQEVVEVSSFTSNWE